MQVQELKINSERLNGRLDELSKIGRIGDTGVCRPALSIVEKEAFERVGSWMKEAGLKVRIDHFGNLIGRMEGKNPDAPVLMMGSHLDSQPYGGRYDGPAGVLSAIEAVSTLNEQGITPERPIEVVSFVMKRAGVLTVGCSAPGGFLASWKKLTWSVKTRMA